MRAAALAVLCALAISCAKSPPVAEPRGPVPAVRDGLLDELAGSWSVMRSIRSEVVENVVDAAWVLGHQFLQLHYRDPARREYEALVYIGKAEGDGYVAYWMDVHGGPMSARGNGKRAGDAIELVFDYPSGPFYNTYTFDRAAGTWTSQMRSKSADGSWQDFANDTFRKR